MQTEENLQLATTYRFWVEGYCVIHAWEEDRRAAADRLSQEALVLGLETFRHVVAPGVDPTEPPPRKKWTLRRISNQDLLSCIVNRPGILFTDIVNDLYREEPWSTEREARAVGRLRVALHRLRKTGVVVKRFNEAGEECWQAANVGTGLALTAAGPAALRPNESALPPADLLAGQLDAGAETLRRYNVFSEKDPEAYRDLAREVYRVMSDQRV